MIRRMLSIAPAHVWILVSCAALLLLSAFVVLSHAMMRFKAYESEFNGPLAFGSVETLLRSGVALLAAGLLLWGLALGWPIVLLLGLGLLAALTLAGELGAQLRQRTSGPDG